jgi:hypothetical protein
VTVGASALSRSESDIGIAAPGSAEPAVGHDQLDLLILDRVAPHLAAVEADAATAVSAVQSGGADPNHDQRLVTHRLEPVERAMRQQDAFAIRYLARPGRSSANRLITR